MKFRPIFLISFNSVKTTNKTIDVFRLLDNTKRTAVGVVEETGDIIGNVSGKDLKVHSVSELSM